MLKSVFVKCHAIVHSKFANEFHVTIRDSAGVLQTLPRLVPAEQLDDGRWATIAFSEENGEVQIGAQQRFLWVAKSDVEECK